MKTIIVTCTLALLLATALQAQEIKPSEQAQGMTQFQNTAVDYSTGIFSYRIPLFELSSGDYKLPVALSYTANGVKVKDKPGVCGHGWSFLAGGVVTRTVRGGIPDENPYATGYACGTLTTLTDSIRRLVNKHEKDGESDIFTAIFNGRRVNFIILPLKDSLYRVRAVPLEKTNVKIDNNSMGEILSWRLTDEDGVIYIFDEIERTTMVDIEEGVSSNSVTRDSYNSSWYLTRIIIPSAPDIKFRYTDQKIFYYDDPNTPYYQEYTDYSNMLYSYGRPLSEYLFDMNTVRETLDQHFADAHAYAISLSFGLQVEGARAAFERFEMLKDNFTRSALLPIDQTIINTISFINKINGFLGDIENLAYPYSEVISVLDNIIAGLTNVANASWLRTEIISIRQIYKEVATTITPVHNKLSGAGRRHRIYSKYLTGVTCGDQEVAIKYHENFMKDRALKEIVLLNYFRDTITSVQLDVQNKLLKKITCKYPKTSLSMVQQFSYFNELDCMGANDIFGYYNGRISGEPLSLSGVAYPYIYVPNVSTSNILYYDNYEFSDGYHNSQHVKSYSLKNITTSRGSAIELDYEPNQVYYYGNSDFGGIRLKSMLLRNGYGSVDSIRYHYTREDGTSSGRFVLNGFSQGKRLDYGSFYDNVLVEGLEDIGNGILNTGNNGVIYEYVKEEHAGNGITSYYFFIPSINYGASNDYYPYWLMGLPLGKIEYDAAGYLVSMQRNSYNGSSVTMTGYSQDFFQTTNVLFPFDQAIQQLKPFGFYMDGETLQSEYASRPNVFLYRDGNTVASINPYYHLYIPNIEPRANCIGPDQNYLLYAGGKVVLKNIEEYLFDYVSDSITTGNGPRYMDFYDTPPSTGYIMNQTSFQYGSKHCNPIKVTRTRSNGEQVDSYRRIIADLDPGETNQVLQEMLASNMLSPILQEQVFLTKEDSTMLILEKTVQYGKDSIEERKLYLPVKEYNLALPALGVASSLPSINTFTYTLPDNENNHVITNFFYNKPGKHYRLEESIMPGVVRSVVHDRGNGKPVLTVQNTRRINVDAIDRYRALGITNTHNMLMNTGIDLCYFVGNDNVKSLMKNFFDQSILLENRPSIYDRTFLQGELHQAMKSYAACFWSYNDPFLYMEKRDTIIAHRYFLVDEYTDFFKNNSVSSDYATNQEYLRLVECVLNHAKYFTSERMEECKFNVNPDLAGKNTGSTLKIIPQEHLYNLYYVINSSQGDNGMFNCKVIYSDGTSYTFSKPFTIASSGWRVNVLEIDLNEIPGKENIVSLEASPVSYTSLSRGIALSVLVPMGTEFEAVSRDQLGRVFCKLNHLQQLERYEYDGLGRVIKVFDARGNVLQEFEYNEIAITN